MIQTADPEISKEKFEIELANFRKSYPLYRKKGILLLDYSFPDVRLAFMATKISPSPLIFAVRINFTNYDLEPPSIRFIDPFSDNDLVIGQLPHQFPRKISQEGNNISVQPLVISQADGIPFFCIPGVREYHHHPAHTGDNWLLHRGIAGEGSLGFLVEKLYQYGIAGVNGIQIPLSFHKVTITFDPQSIPE